MNVKPAPVDDDQAAPASTLRLTVVLGTAAVTAYALIGILTILVLNPLAAVPGSDLAQINETMRAANESMAPIFVCVTLLLGPIGAVIIAAVAWTRNRRAGSLAVTYLVILLFGAPAYMMASFPAGMGLADTYGISGADYAPTGYVLYLVSCAAGIALLVTVALRPLLNRRRTAAP